MIVKNINGTTDNICHCPSWLEHWKKFGGNTVPSRCPVVGCLESPSVGAHVQKHGGLLDQDWYIIPLCQKHNKREKEYIINDTTPLIPAKVKDTCGKSK